MRELSMSKELSTAAASEGSNDFTDKVLRELQLFGQTFGGASDAAVRSVDRDHIGETALKTTIGVGLGLGLAYLSKGAAWRQMTAKVAGSAMGVAFASDIAMKGQDVLAVAQDTWRSDLNFDRNRQFMRQTMGQFVFDSALMTAAGLGGVGLAQSRLFNPSPKFEVARVSTTPHATPSETPLEPLPNSRWVDNIMPTLRHRHTGNAPQDYNVDTPLAATIRDSHPSVVRLVVPRADNPTLGHTGTGFFVDTEGTIATAFHVVENGAGKSFVHMGGKKYCATVTRVDPSTDLAVLKLDHLPLEPIKPLQLAEVMPSAKSAEVVALGHADGNKLLHASPGTVEAANWKLEWIRADRAPRESLEAMLLKLAVRTREGCSGGPVLCVQSGKVIGVTSFGGESTTYARQAPELLALLKRPS